MSFAKAVPLVVRLLAATAALALALRTAAAQPTNCSARPCTVCAACCRAWINTADSCQACTASECGTPNVCAPPGSGACNVCAACCAVPGGLAKQADCDRCVYDKCGGAGNSRRCQSEAPFDCSQQTADGSCSSTCVKQCWTHPLTKWTLDKCLEQCTLCHAGGLLALLVLVPFAGRFVLDALLSQLKGFILEQCRCNKVAGVSEEEERLVSEPITGSEGIQQKLGGNYEGRAGFTCNDVNRSGSSWAAACRANRQSPLMATVGVALPRLLLWHCAQPLLYLAVLSCYYGGLDAWQKVFGVAVAVREGLYLISTLACVAVNPAFLLIDVLASFRDDKLSFLMMYTFYPDKAVLGALLGEGGLGLQGVRKVWFLGAQLLDLCGVGALVAGLAAGNLQAAMAIGYAATTLGVIVLHSSRLV